MNDRKNLESSLVNTDPEMEFKIFIFELWVINCLQTICQDSAVMINETDTRTIN